MCSFRLHFWLKRLPQTSQRYGFSPVWILLCRSRCPARSKHFPQYGQMKPFLNINLFTVLLRTVLYKLRYWLKPSRPRPDGLGWNPAELPQEAARPASREASGRHSREFWPKFKYSEPLCPVWVWVVGLHCVPSRSCRPSWSGCPPSSSFPASTGSHFTCTSGKDRLLWSWLSACSFSRDVLPSPTSLWLSVEKKW